MISARGRWPCPGGAATCIVGRPELGRGPTTETRAGRPGAQPRALEVDETRVDGSLKVQRIP
eukprot:957313-Alexandrium_andersonii.AAC.1